MLNSNLFYPLVLSVITGVTLIAYKHPKGYIKIFRAVLPIILFLAFCIICGELGSLISGISGLKKEVTKQGYENFTMLKYYSDSLSQNFTMMIKVFIIGVAIAGYMIFLYYLPNILEINNAKDKEKNNPTGKTK
jgi:hypothetical protein